MVQELGTADRVRAGAGEDILSDFSTHWLHSAGISSSRPQEGVSLLEEGWKIELGVTLWTLLYDSVDARPRCLSDQPSNTSLADLS